jgi:cbb3-type cytochrome oxidase maturation protein
LEILIILIAFSIAVAGAFLGAFIWAMKNGQYEDTFTPSVRILFDREEGQKSAQNNQHSTTKQP